MTTNAKVSVCCGAKIMNLRGNHYPPGPPYCWECGGNPYQTKEERLSEASDHDNPATIAGTASINILEGR